jgi:TRAP-type C4-dicarboxylate transport system permease small subunit
VTPAPGRRGTRRLRGLLAGLQALNARIDVVAAAVVTATVATMFLVVVAQVFCRYVLDASLVWAEEAARYLLVLTTFAGASVAMRRGAHMTVHLVVSALPAGGRSVAEALAQTACCLVYAVLVRHGLALAGANFDQASPALGLPLGAVYLLIPLAGLLLGLQAVERIALVLAGGPPAPPARESAGGGR